MKFSVRDTGIGISQEKQKEIFSPFFQADSSTTRRFGGTGLGLSISRWLVSEMGGEMGVVSVLGSGSEFWFTLTLEKAKYSPISTTESSGLEVLIADDSSIACDAMRNIVAMLGWKADIVSSGEEALQHVLSRFQSVKADDSRKRVIILDWKMPGMDGLATARAIREYVKDGNDPIIVMVTAFSRNEVLALPDSKYVNAVLNKPVTPSSLNGTISNLLSVQVDDKTTVSKALGQRLSGLRLLIVDDSDINREVARRIFSNEGASIVLANDGRQALAWLESHPGGVDLVIMDVQMPVMDGYETTRRIRTIPALASIPVIAVTAGAFKDQQEAAKAAGMDDFIAKPIDVENAIALILYRAGLRDKRGSVKTADQTASRSYDNLPDLDEEHGLAVWQDQLVYKQYLRKFAKDYGGSTANMKQMGNLQAAELAHKLKGAAGSLALTKLETLANEISRILRAGQDATEITTQLQVALDNA
ncbi:MAG: response regulator, partial [Gammaproteobacteria bacterium]